MNITRMILCIMLLGCKTEEVVEVINIIDANPMPHIPACELSDVTIHDGINYDFFNTRPNIIFILADDLGKDAIGLYGGQSYSTPNLCEMASEGIVYQNCYATPLCTPSRVKFLTGRYGSRNYNRFANYPQREKSLAKYLEKQNYNTGIVGKWQLGGDVGLPHRLGFKEYFLWDIGPEKGERYYAPIFYKNEQRIDRSDQYGPDVLLEEAKLFLNKNKDEPFFLFYSMLLPHFPFFPSPADSTAVMEDDPKNFGSMVTYMDYIVGELNNEIEELNLSSNTLIVFTSDNGTDNRVTSLYKHENVFGRKGFTNKLGTNVPLIIKWQGALPGNVVSTKRIDYSDFLSTFIYLAGDIPDKSKLDGYNIFSNNEKRPFNYNYFHPNLNGFNESKHTTYIFNDSVKYYDTGKIYDITSMDLENESNRRIFRDLSESGKETILDMRDKLDSLNQL